MTVATSATVRNLTSEMSPVPEPGVGPEFEAMMHRTFVHIRPPASLPEPLRLCLVRSEPSVTVGNPGVSRTYFLPSSACRMDAGPESRSLRVGGAYH